MNNPTISIISEYEQNDNAKNKKSAREEQFYSSPASHTLSFTGGSHCHTHPALKPYFVGVIVHHHLVQITDNHLVVVPKNLPLPDHRVGVPRPRETEEFIRVIASTGFTVYPLH